MSPLQKEILGGEMNRVRSIIGIGYIIISVFCSFLLVQLAVNYVNVTQASLSIPPTIKIVGFQIPKIYDESKNVELSVLYNVSNPSHISVYVYNIEYKFYMDNASDPREWWNPLKLRSEYVGIGGFSFSKEESYVLEPGGTRTLYANMTVLGGTSSMKRLNVTASDGKYYPVVDSTVRFDFLDFERPQIVRLGLYWHYVGVEPYG